MSRHLTLPRLWIACLAFLAATTALGIGCADRDDGVSPKDCGETATRCDGQ